MEYKRIDDRHYVVRIDKGEEVFEQLRNFCDKENINAGEIRGIGASDKIEIGLFNTKTKEYKTSVKEGMFEITSLLGNISRKDSDIYLHAHINFSDESLNVYGGHLVKCYISATCELVITVLNGTINRDFNEEIGLNLFNLN